MNTSRYLQQVKMIVGCIYSGILGDTKLTTVVAVNDSVLFKVAIYN